MITEDYVSFETAKLLKEKGFDTPCDRWYSEYTPQYYGYEKHICIEFDEHHRYENNYEFICYAPTLQMAMKWLREVHKLFIFISPWILLENNIQYYFEIREIKTRDFETLYDCTSKELNSFEKVTETAIKYCLENLI